MFVFTNTLELLLFFIFIFCDVCYCQRRIEEGMNLTTSSPKPYVVYLTKAEISKRNYDFWLCGGALVTKDFILTSAACVSDVNYLYAIAGYDKYVIDEDIEKDECTKKMKKKVIFTCVPVSYNFDFDLLEKWSYIDIALVKVESPYDFTDTTYTEICSYIPTTIPINYDPKYQMADIDAIVLGWGHDLLWRKHGDIINYNAEKIEYAPTLVMDKRDCMKSYEVYPNMTYIIEQYMICTLEEGNLNDKGDPIVKSLPTAEGCTGTQKAGREGEDCEEQNDANQFSRRDISNDNRTYYNYTTYEYIKKAARERRFNRTRRSGICQNDHGGPLVTWVGTREVVIGVASVFKINEASECIGPFLYTSTQCNGAFLDCVLNADIDQKNKKRKSRRMLLCDSPPSVKGFDMVKNHISWKNHPAGPAHNEMPHNNIPIKPVVPHYQPNPNTYQNYKNPQYSSRVTPHPQYGSNGLRGNRYHEYGAYPEHYKPPLARYQGNRLIPGFENLDEPTYSMRPQNPYYEPQA
ncbi:uncharacterized protein LOC110377142 [Helicoverpa armigera]|uniref:uncharacterized protein LOC110377142 n=1 Tax=Helicoverpa armigera TaxID=29058 RepID=UPI003082C8A8